MILKHQHKGYFMYRLFQRLDAFFFAFIALDYEDYQAAYKMR